MVGLFLLAVAGMIWWLVVVSDAGKPPPDTPREPVAEAAPGAQSDGSALGPGQPMAEAVGAGPTEAAISTVTSDDLPAAFAAAEAAKQRILAAMAREEALRADPVVLRFQAQVQTRLLDAASAQRAGDTVATVRALREAVAAGAGFDAYLRALEATGPARQVFQTAVAEAVTSGLARLEREAFSAALAARQDAESAVAAGDVSAALGAYQRGSAALSAGQERLSGRVAAARAAVEEGFRQGNEVAVRDGLAFLRDALPGDAEAARWEARLPLLGQVFRGWEAAQRSLAVGDLEVTEGRLRQVLALDADFEPAVAMLEEVEKRRRRALGAERLAFSEAAFSEGRVLEAWEAVQEARRLDPDLPGLAAIEPLVRAEAEAVVIQREVAAATAFLDARQWDAAETAFRTLLRSAPELAAAQEGVATARRRKREERQIERVLIAAREAAETPTPAQLAYSIELIEQHALTLDPDHLGSRRLLEVLKERQRLVEQPVMLALTSDGRTTVTIWRVKTLAPFTRETLSLKPGSYQLVAQREGFRDVFQEIVVPVEGPPMELHVVCEPSSATQPPLPR